MGADAIDSVLLYHTKNYQGTTTFSLSIFTALPLYHTKNYQGTTTTAPYSEKRKQLYHTKNYQGTTTPFPKKIQGIQLYHTKNYLAGAAFSSAQASDGSEKCRFSACFTRTDERIPTENGG